jgi:hypothetical protein
MNRVLAPNAGCFALASSARRGSPLSRQASKALMSIASSHVYVETSYF